MLKTLLQEQKAYYLSMFTYFIIGVALLSSMDKGDLVLYFSENRTSFWNEFFLATNRFGEVWTIVIGFLVLFFIKIRYALFVPVVAGVVGLASMMLKKIFAHLRPKLWFEQQDIFLNFVPDVYINSGYTSFPSGHTFAAFALFGYFALVSKSPILKILFSVCAIFGGLARVYLSQHFLEDILFGGFLGMATATLVFLLQKRLNNQSEKWWNISIYNKIKNT